jgi:hypothetical protein
MAPMDLPQPHALRIAAESKSFAEEKESYVSLWLYWSFVLNLRIHWAARRQQSRTNRARD